MLFAVTACVPEPSHCFVAGFVVLQDDPLHMDEVLVPSAKGLLRTFDSSLGMSYAHYPFAEEALKVVLLVVVAGVSGGGSGSDDFQSLTERPHDA